MDPQANLTHHLGIKPHTLHSSIRAVLEGKSWLQDTRIKLHKEFQSLDLIPANLTLAETEARIFNKNGREFLLREVLAVGWKKTYESILIYCPPSLSVLTLNALIAASEACIPLEFQPLALQGLRAIRDIIELDRKRLNPSLKLTGIIATKYDNRLRLSREVLETLREHFGDLLFKTEIRGAIKLAEAPSYRQDIFHYAPKSHEAEDYLALCREIIREEKHND